jgi:hypothetical protein
MDNSLELANLALNAKEMSLMPVAAAISGIPCVWLVNPLTTVLQT